MSATSGTADSWPQYQYRAELVRVKDGDTAVLRVDLGFEVFIHVSVRLTGYNAPEMRGPSKLAAFDARLKLMGILGRHTLFIRTHRDARSFERYLADVFVADPNSDSGALVAVSDLMKAAGFDVPQGD